jgi:hypothetical protein
MTKKIKKIVIVECPVVSSSSLALNICRFCRWYSGETEEFVTCEYWQGGE